MIRKARKAKNYQRKLNCYIGAFSSSEAPFELMERETQKTPQTSMLGRPVLAGRLCSCTLRQSSRRTRGWSFRPVHPEEIKPGSREDFLKNFLQLILLVFFFCRFGDMSTRHLLRAPNKIHRKSADKPADESTPRNFRGNEQEKVITNCSVSFPGPPLRWGSRFFMLGRVSLVVLGERLS